MDDLTTLESELRTLSREEFERCFVEAEEYGRTCGSEAELREWRREMRVYVRVSEECFPE